MRRRAGTLLLGLFVASAQAHELRTVGLWLDESPPGRVEVRLEVPLDADGGAAAIVPRFDPGCRIDGAPRTAREADAVLRHFSLACDRPLAGQSITLEGLDPRIPDAVVIARLADGAVATQALDRHAPTLRIVPAAPGPAGLGAYFGLGVMHILLGADHLLFVLGLVLAVAAGGFGPRRLVLALTAFTLAHSLTLALATLGLWGLPPKVTEVLIALSIVTLALELARHAAQRGTGAPALTLALRYPAAIAFGFGLLHGFGFAGALAEIGLPPQARAWALLLFNLGVEAGQLLFVGALLGLGLLARRAGPVSSGARAALATALGGIATYWMFDRLLDWAATLQGLPT